jgi:hypothetical protein
MVFADIVSGIGVFLILLAFFLQTFHWLQAGSRLYLWLNVVGSALAGYGSYLIDSVPFMILEGTWCVVSVVGLLQKKSTPVVN